MGWSCQHDYKGYCKLLSKECLPGMKGCTLKGSGYTFSTGNYEDDKKAADKANDKDGSAKEEIDFVALAKSN